MSARTTWQYNGANLCRHHDHFLVLSVLTLLSIVFLSPLLCIMWVVLTVHRELAEFFAIRRDSSLRERMTGLDAIFAAKYQSERNPECVVCIYIPILESVTYADVMRALRKRIPFQDGRFPTLTQAITQKYGYLFWKQVTKFEIKDHIRLLDGSGTGGSMFRAELRSLCMNQLLREPFPQNQSPWECLVVEKLVDEEDAAVKSAIIFRYHHCLMDGHSLMKFLEALSFSSTWNGLGGKKREIGRSPGKHEINTAGFPLWILNTAGRFWNILVIAFTAPYYFWQAFLFSNDDTSKYHRNHSSFTISDGGNVEQLWFSRETGLIPMQRLKEIKDKTGSNLSSVIFTLATEMVTQSIQRSGELIPRKMHCVFPYPMTKIISRDRLSNNFVALKLPIHSQSSDNANNVYTTLREIDYTFEKLRSSKAPKIMEVITSLIGSLPVSLIPGYDESTQCTFTVSNFPGPVTHNQQLDLLGYSYKEIGFSVTPPKNLHIFLGCVSVNGQMRFHVATRKNVMFQEDMDAALLTKDIIRTLDRLEAENN